MQQPQQPVNEKGLPNATLPLSLFESEILQGLQANPKTLPSKYFYDRKGDALFQQIMQLPEYYLTRAELAILQENAARLLSCFSAKNQPFSLIELGAGDGLKTKVLLHRFCQAKANFIYVPIDISANALLQLSQTVKAEIPEVEIKPLCLDYFQGLDLLGQQSAMRKVVLFLGSSIGNLTTEQATNFLREINAHLQPGDLLLTGFDLVKAPQKILAAYNDSSGVTAAFNLNLLTRINRETGAGFDLAAFQHFALYDPLVAEARSYLISTKAQSVHFPNSNQEIKFAAWEAIHTEISRKYSVADTHQLATKAGFSVLAEFTDGKQQFLDALWQKS